jgi:hypothetical protein
MKTEPVESEQRKEGEDISDREGSVLINAEQVPDISN